MFTLPMSDAGHGSAAPAAGIRRASMTMVSALILISILQPAAASHLAVLGECGRYCSCCMQARQASTAGACKMLMFHRSCCSNMFLACFSTLLQRTYRCPAVAARYQAVVARRWPLLLGLQPQQRLLQDSSSSSQHQAACCRHGHQRILQVVTAAAAATLCGKAGAAQA
jgi:hypothetical protein